MHPVTLTGLFSMERCRRLEMLRWDTGAVLPEEFAPHLSASEVRQSFMSNISFLHFLQQHLNNNGIMVGEKDFLNDPFIKYCA